MLEPHCENGRAMQHTPGHDDPHHETCVGVCERCDGEGCEGKLQRLIGRAMPGLEAAITTLEQVERETDRIVAGANEAALGFFGTEIGGFDIDLSLRGLRQFRAYQLGQRAWIDEGDGARNPFAMANAAPGFIRSPDVMRERAAWAAGFASGGGETGRALVREAAE